MRVNENILISSLTTMRLGGPARYVLEVETPSEVADAYGFAEQFRLPTFILGYGANTLGHDEGFPGVIIINRMKGITSVPWAGDGAGGTPAARSRQASTVGETATAGPAQRIKIMGGEYWDDVVAFACEKGFTGIEALSKIPGLAGAAPVQNIGAYGQELADTFVELEAYDSASRTFVTLKKSDLNFGYRSSILNTTQKNRYFVISITLALKSGEMPRPFYNSLQKYLDERNITNYGPASIRTAVSAIRADKLPDPLKTPSAGSFFKNIYLSDEDAEKYENKGYPVIRGKDGNKINSGWFIEQAGLAGKTLHGIKISDKAALVLINESAKSYNDLAAARSEIVAKVYDEFGFWLEQEPVELQ